MNTPQEQNIETQATLLAAALKQITPPKRLSEKEVAAIQVLNAEIQRLLPPAMPSFKGRPRQFSREQQEGI